MRDKGGCFWKMTASIDIYQVTCGSAPPVVISRHSSYSYEIASYRDICDKLIKIVCFIQYLEAESFPVICPRQRLCGLNPLCPGLPMEIYGIGPGLLSEQCLSLTVSDRPSVLSLSVMS